MIGLPLQHNTSQSNLTCPPAVHGEGLTRIELTQLLYQTYHAIWNLEGALAARGVRVPAAKSLPGFEMNLVANRVAEFVGAYVEQHGVGGHEIASITRPTGISISTSDTGALELLVIESLFFHNYLRAQSARFAGQDPSLTIIARAPTVPEDMRRVAATPQAFFADERIRARYHGVHPDVLAPKSDPEASSSAPGTTSPGSMMPEGREASPAVGEGSFAEMRGPSTAVEEPMRAAGADGMAALFEEERRKLTEEIHKKDQELNDSRVEIRRLTAAAESFHREASERIKQGEASSGAYRSELELLRHQLQQASNEGARSQKEAAELQRKDAQIDRLTRQVASLRSHAAEHLDREKILNAQLTQSQKVQGDLREALERSEHTITSLRTTREADSKEIAELRLTIENLNRRCETLGSADLQTQVSKGKQLEAEVVRLRAELEAMQERRAIDQIRIEAQAHKIKAQEWFRFESYTHIKEAASDGRLVELLDPQAVVDLLEKIDQLKGDVEHQAKMRSGKGRYRRHDPRGMETDIKPKKDIA